MHTAQPTQKGKKTRHLELEENQLTTLKICKSSTFALFLLNIIFPRSSKQLTQCFRMRHCHVGYINLQQR